MVFKCSLTRSKWGQCFKTCLSASQTWVMLGSENRTVIMLMETVLRLVSWTPLEDTG